MASPPHSLRPWPDALCGALAGGLAGFLARDLGLVDLASAWASAAVLGAVVAALGARAVVAATLAALAAAWLAVAFTPLASRFADGLVRRDPLARSEAVVVLSSRLQADGEPTTVAENRLVHAVQLVAGGWAPRLVVTEMLPPAASNAALAKQTLARFQVTAEVLSVGPVRRTRDEAVAIAALCRERGWPRVLLVTSPLHSRRGAASLEEVGVGVLSSPCLETQFDLETLDRPVERLRAFASALHERVGLWYYEREGWVGSGAGPGG